MPPTLITRAPPPIPLPWDREKLFFDNEVYFEELTRALDEAQTSIDMEMYIFLPDEMGRWMEDTLIKAAQRGVRVRLLIDGIGALAWVGAWKKEFEECGVELKIWNPVYTGPFWTGIVGAIRRKGIARFLFNVNRRTHRKYVVIDHYRAFVGSQNISREHVPRFNGKKAWRDTGIELEGSAIHTMERAFRHAWDRSYVPDGRRPHWFKRHRAPKIDRKCPVRFNITRRMRFRFWRDLLGRIRRCENRIWITTPYLAPTGFLLRALKKAKSRGCDVRILLPAHSDVFFMRWIQTSYYDFLLKHQIRVFEYEPTFLHAKSMLLDDWAMVGTTNMNTRSFLHDLEIDIVVTGAGSKVLLAEQFAKDLSQAREISREELEQKAWISRLGRWVSFFLRYWI